MSRLDYCCRCPGSCHRSHSSIGGTALVAISRLLEVILLTALKPPYGRMKPQWLPSDRTLPHNCHTDNPESVWSGSCPCNRPAERERCLWIQGFRYLLPVCVVILLGDSLTNTQVGCPKQEFTVLDLAQMLEHCSIGSERLVLSTHSKR